MPNINLHRWFTRPAPMARAYRVPHSKDLHALLNQGMKKARLAVSRMGSAEPKAGKRGTPWQQARAT